MSNKSQKTRIKTVIPKQPVIAESDAMLNILYNEVDTILKKTSEKPKKQQWRRVFIRSIFAYIEGSCFRMKQDALSLNDEFTLGEKILSEEIEYMLNDKGDVIVRKAHLKSIDNLKFSFKMLAIALSIDFELNLQGSGWANYKKALKIRHRITHPKILHDLVVNDNEFEIALSAWKWFHEQQIELFKPFTKD